jgi:Barstar (barnase inhibitor)
MCKAAPKYYVFRAGQIWAILRCVTVVYVIDGGQVGSLEDFWRVIGEAVNGPGGYFGQNLDAFNDCLRGGTPVES